VIGPCGPTRDRRSIPGQRHPSRMRYREQKTMWVVLFEEVSHTHGIPVHAKKTSGAKGRKRTGMSLPGVEPGASPHVRFRFLPFGDEVSLSYGILMMMRSTCKEHPPVRAPPPIERGPSIYNSTFMISATAFPPASIAFNTSKTFSLQPAIRNTSLPCMLSGVLP
jgi:hypothetical protein